MKYSCNIFLSKDLCLAAKGTAAVPTAAIAAICESGIGSEAVGLNNSSARRLITDDINCERYSGGMDSSLISINGLSLRAFWQKATICSAVDFLITKSSE